MHKRKPRVPAIRVERIDGQDRLQPSAARQRSQGAQGTGSRTFSKGKCARGARQFLQRPPSWNSQGVKRRPCKALASQKANGEPCVDYWD